MPAADPDREHGELKPERVALVTGAARGIGQATVRELLRQGYCVTALDGCGGGERPAGVYYPLATPSDLARVAAADPLRVLPVEGDVRDLGVLEAAVGQTISRFGRIDAVVAAAGVMVGGQTQWDTPEDHLRTLWDINVHGVWNTAKATVPALLNNAGPDQGRFVAIASAAGERGLFRLAAYTASKHAVVGIVRGLAADLVGTGVTATAVSPGSTDTPMLSATAALYDVTPQVLAHHQGIHRLLAPAEIAATVAHCCSPAGAALNGSVVRADGGFGT